MTNKIENCLLCKYRGIMFCQVHNHTPAHLPGLKRWISAEQSFIQKGDTSVLIDLAGTLTIDSECEDITDKRALPKLEAE